MKIVSANIFALNIPFVESFSHNLNKRTFSDSIIIKLNTEDGLSGFGEGVARPYVTGETVKRSIEYIKKVLFPVIKSIDFPDLDISNKSYKALSFISNHLPSNKSPGIIAWNASRTAVELAIIDCLLKKKTKSLNSILPVKSETIIYTGVIPSGTIENTAKIAKYFKSLDLKYIKIKIGTIDDYGCIAIVREIMGPLVSIRLDANCAFNLKKAIKFISSIHEFNIESIEQPIPRGNISELSIIKSNSPIPIMADESIVTIDDAEKLIEFNACDYFNLRISKCGGIYNTLLIADIAKKAGIRIQIGCHVGETAILSAAGRHVAAHLNNLRFVEGSYGKLLLAEDITRDNIQFGHGGEAPVLIGDGLGINVQEDCLKRYAKEVITI